jgi:histidinol-phosphate aminotransferase
MRGMSLSSRPQIQGMSPYSPGKPIEEVQRELGLSKVIKLASNENPLGPSPKAVEAVQKAAGQMHLYPDASAHRLRVALAENSGLQLDQIMVGNGSDELIHYLGLVMLEGEDTELVIGDPTFVRYEASGQLASSRVVKVPLDSAWRHDVEAMAAACSPKTRLVYIANPNNPTGTAVTLKEVEWLAERIPEGALLVHDEAYYEYSRWAEGCGSAAGLVKKGLPVAFLRTFSKAYGLAGIRVGWGGASAEVTDLVNRIREPFNVNTLAQEAAIAALGDEDHLRRTVIHNRRGLEGIQRLAEDLGFSVVESHANFVCIDLGRPAKPVFEALLKKGVITRSGHVLGMVNHLRVSIGSEEEMAVFAESFVDVVKGG